MFEHLLKAAPCRHNTSARMNSDDNPAPPHFSEVCILAENCATAGQLSRAQTGAAANLLLEAKAHCPAKAHAAPGSVSGEM